MSALEPCGRKEVGQAVVIAALTTLANALIQWSLDTIKAKAAAYKEKAVALKKKCDDDVMATAIPLKEVKLPAKIRNARIYDRPHARIYPCPPFIQVRSARKVDPNTPLESIKAEVDIVTYKLATKEGAQVAIDQKLQEVVMLVADYQANYGDLAEIAYCLRNEGNLIEAKIGIKAVVQSPVPHTDSQLAC